MERKLTDSEVVKALKCCFIIRDHKGCPLAQFGSNVTECRREMAENVIDLINRRNAEIKELQSEIKILKDSNINLHELYQNEKEKVAKAKRKVIDIGRALKTAKADATISFAKRLCDGRVSNDPVVIAVDTLIMEMTEGAHYEIRKDLADL